MQLKPVQTIAARTGKLSVCVLASGSRGNAIHIDDGETALLIDAGLSGVELQRRMDQKGLNPKNITAILVSHEHSDHIQGVGVLSRRFKLPVYINEGTRLATGSSLGKLTTVKSFTCGHTFSVDSLTIHPFSISHDAEDPAGFTIGSNGCKVGIATDLGIVTGVVKTHLTACNILIIEANHDPKMLIDGPYPWPLKQRIQGRSGHLSNADTAELLQQLLHENLSHVILAHVSEENNTPEKALQTVEEALNGSQVKVHVASQASGSCVLSAGF
jgi:phosphoribosyl 1,2-cyclic phosphodiesterase